MLNGEWFYDSYTINDNTSAPNPRMQRIPDKNTRGQAQPQGVGRSIMQ
jgi:hypothetical protein